MAARPTTPARSSELITLARVKELLGIEAEDRSQDALLTYYIGLAAAAVVEECGFPLGRATYLETRRGSGKTGMYIGPSTWLEPESLSIKIDGEEIDDYTLEDPEWGLLYRGNRWPCASDGEANLSFTYRAGYLLPGDITDWTATAAIGLGSFVRPTSAALLRFECTTAGSTGATEPTWPEEAGGTVTDGSVVWTARNAAELPAIVSDWAYGIALQRYNTRSFPAGMSSIEADGFSASFFASQTSESIPPNVRDGIRRWATGRGWRA
jgi:hypothetical protein